MIIFSIICLIAAIGAAAYAIAADRRAATARAEADMARAMLERSSAENAAAEERFRSLAAEALVANARALDADNRRSLDAALAPMARRIQEMEKTFRETYSAEARERFSLADRVRELVGRGPGSFRMALLDAAGTLRPADLESRTRIEQLA